MRQLFFLCIALFTLSGCNNQSTVTEPITISVDLNQAIDITSSSDFSVQEINMDEKEGVDTRYSMLCSVIPTESTLVFCTDTKAYVLDNDGHLIHKMGDQGNAANEYLKIWSLFLKKDGRIIINDSQKLLEYTADGEFVKKYDIPTFAGYALPFVGDRFYFVNVVDVNKSNLIVLDSNFDEVQQVDSLKLPLSLHGCVTSNQKDFLFFYFPQSINVLTSDLKVQQKYRLDFGKENPIIEKKGELLSEDQMMENFTKRAALGGALRDTQSALYFDVMCTNALFLVKYDKKTNQTTAYKVFEADSPFISNNNKFHNNRYGYIRSSENGMMVGVVTITK